MGKEVEINVDEFWWGYLLGALSIVALKIVARIIFDWIWS